MLDLKPMANKVAPTMRLTEPAEIPEQYKTICVDFLRQLWERHRWLMQERWGFHNLPIMPEDDLLRALLAEEVATIARAAAGELAHDEWNAGIVEETVQTLMETVFSNATAYNYTIPTEFWNSDVGQMVARAMLWVRGDELITITEAAEIRGVTPQAISQAVDAGRLTAHIDPGAPQRQGRRLVVRSEVEAM